MYWYAVNLTLLQDRGDLLTFTEDRFHINGTMMGSAFGYAVEVVDLNNDGFVALMLVEFPSHIIFFPASMISLLVLHSNIALIPKGILVELSTSITHKE